MYVFCPSSRDAAQPHAAGKTVREYIETIAHREIAWISQYATPKLSIVPGQISAAQNSPPAHIDFLQKYLGVIHSLLPIEDTILSPTLWHRDLHKGNMFVYQGKISSIIDWQSVWIGPRIIQVRAPLLVDYSGEIILKLPENFKELDPEEQSRLQDQVQRSIQVYIYELNTSNQNPTLNKILRYPNGKTLDQLVEFAGATWDGDILPL